MALLEQIKCSHNILQIPSLLAWRYPPWQSRHLFTYCPSRKAVLVFSCLFYSHKTTVTDENLGRTEVSMHSCLTEGFINHLMLIYISIYPGVYTLLFFFLKDNHCMWVSVVSNVDLFLLYPPQCYRRQLPDYLLPLLSHKKYLILHLR